MKILVIGTSSYVGARIYFDLKDKYELIGTYFNNPLSDTFINLDLTNKEAVDNVFSEYKPKIIIHVANYPSPSNAKDNEENFIKLNKQATEYLVEVANKNNCKVIFISSQASVNPTNIYGKLKLESEEEIKKVKAGYLILRPSLIVGYSPNIKSKRTFNKILGVLDQSDLADKFDTSWVLQPTYLGHLSQVIDKFIEQGKWNIVQSIYINESVTQHQIASDILKEFDKQADEVDFGLDIPLSKEDLTEFEELNLKPKTYKEMVEVIVQEIKDRDKFVL